MIFEEGDKIKCKNGTPPPKKKKKKLTNKQNRPKPGRLTERQCFKGTMSHLQAKKMKKLNSNCI